MNSLRHALVVGLLALPLIAPATEAARTYKWVDEDGVTHYTQYPPPDRDAQVVEPSIGLPSDTGANDRDDTGRTSSDDSGGGSADSGPKTIDAHCAQLREQLKLLNSGQGVRVKNEDGSLTALEGDARAAKRADIATRINRNCSN